VELSAGTHYCPYHKKKDSSGLNLKCKDCGTENPEDAQFCLECGSKLEKTQKISEDTPLKDRDSEKKLDCGKDKLKFQKFW